MRGKRKICFCCAALSVVIITGCGNDASISGRNKDAMTESKSRTESATDEATQESETDEATQESPVKIPEENRKATGFEYDRNNLTYELVWSDEFDYEGTPDTEKWGYDVGGGGWGNNERQTYTAGENVSVSGGVMTIELRMEPELKRFSSTRLVTKGKGDWTYCKVEVSAKLPVGVGTWPAIWMLPSYNTYGTWPKSGEIDIMEHVGFDQDVIVQTVHTAMNHGSSGQGLSTPTKGVSEEFHTYSVEWLPDKLIFSIDGEETYTYDPHNYSEQPLYFDWPFDKDMHLLINLAYGGDWGGAQGIDLNCLPATYEIDYVRVYQSPEIRELTGQNVTD